jgi:hypothetical protein
MVQDRRRARAGVSLSFVVMMVLSLAPPADAQSSVRVFADLPASNGTLIVPFAVSGWALASNAASGSGVDAVHVWAFPAGGGSAVFVGAATLNGNRPDVAQVFGSQFAGSGFGLTVTHQLPAGAYTLRVYARQASTLQWAAMVEIPVAVTKVTLSDLSCGPQQVPLWNGIAWVCSDLPSGQTGVAGPTGPAGPAGVTGAAGPTGATGAAGPTGPAGLSGAPGAAGTTGAAGPTGPTGPPVTFQGTWLIGVTYATGDTVSFNGSSYIGLSGGNTGNTPPAAPWALLAQRGSTGATGAAGAAGTAGATGPTGPPVTFQGTWLIGVTYASGDAVFFNGSSYISLSGGNTGNTPPAAPWALLAQQGSTGATGAPGAAGATGAAGAIGPTGPPVTFQNVWSNLITYASGDAVFFTATGSSYISLHNSNVNHSPPTSPADWALLAQQGATGATGATGPAGAGGAGTFMASMVNPNNLTPWWTTLSADSIQSTNAPEVGGLMPIACTISALHLKLFGISGTTGADTITVTLFKNRVATAMTVTATNPAAGTFGTLVSDTVNTVSVAVGDTLSLGYTQTDNVPFVRISVGTRCQ